MLQGIGALENDPETEVVILVSKPPAPEVANVVLDTVRNLDKEYIVNFLNGDPAEAQGRNLRFAAGLEEAADLAIAALEGKGSVAAAFTDEENKIKALAEDTRRKIGRGKVLRGLFSGGTLAEEALLILSHQIGDIHSNIPLRRELALKDAWKSHGHTIVDLGEDEFTRGRPHPMIDYTLRCDRLAEEATDPDCGFILLDVVLGYGSHPHPAETLAVAIQKAQQAARAEGRYLAFVASICGSDEDPQNFSGQVAVLEEAGVIILPSNARAARFAGLVLTE
jgi:FdrA protein